MCNFGFYGPSFGTMLLANRRVDPIFTCYANLDSPSGMSSIMPGLDYQLSMGNTLPLQYNGYGLGFGGFGLGGFGFGGFGFGGFGLGGFGLGGFGLGGFGPGGFGFGGLGFWC